MKPAIYLGIEIGGTKLQIVTGYGNGTVLDTHRYIVNREAGAEGIRQTISDVIRHHHISGITAAGVGFGGPVHHATGSIANSFQVEGWNGFPLAQWLGSILKVPVHVDNDANVAALGEAHTEAAKNFRSVLYVTLGSGVGGGLVVDKTIFHGQSPGEVEIGHLRFDREGNTMESLCSGWAVDRRIRQAVAEQPGSAIAGLVANRKSRESVILKEALDQKDHTAMSILHDTAGHIAFGLSHAVHLLHPDVVVLGGGLSLVGEPLRAAVQQQLAGLLMTSFSPGPPVRIAALGELAVPVGSLILAAIKTPSSHV